MLGGRSGDHPVAVAAPAPASGHLGRTTMSSPRRKFQHDVVIGSIDPADDRDLSFRVRAKLVSAVVFYHSAAEANLCSVIPGRREAANRRWHQSFRGPSEAREPGIHTPGIFWSSRPGLRIPALALLGRNDRGGFGSFQIAKQIFLYIDYFPI